MGGRDHSETCDVCGMECGGMNNAPCLCEVGATGDAFRSAAEEAIDWRARALAAEARLLGPIGSERDLLTYDELIAERDAWKESAGLCRQQRDEALLKLAGAMEEAVIRGLTTERDQLKAEVIRQERRIEARDDEALGLYRERNALREECEHLKRSLAEALETAKPRRLR